jgi:hypothetical protein
MAFERAAGGAEQARRAGFDAVALGDVSSKRLAPGRRTCGAAGLGRPTAAGLIVSATLPRAVPRLGFSRLLGKDLGAS